MALPGYGMLAEAMVEPLLPVATAQGWGLVVPEARHRFYPRHGRGQVGASWMSAHGREHDIADNLAYLGAVLSQARERFSPGRCVVVGFSQGASQAWRCALALPGVDAVIAVGGDIPTELRSQRPPHRTRALIVRGSRDSIYGQSASAEDGAVVTAWGWDVRRVEVDAGHVFDASVVEAMATWLAP